MGTACQSGILNSDLELDATFVTSTSLDGRPLRLLLDTGSGGSALTAAFVNRAGLELPAAGSVDVLDASGTVRTSGLFLLRGLRLGRNVYQPFPVAVIAMPAAFPADGVLGMDALGSAVWCFDPRRRTVAMLHPDSAERVLADRGHRITDRIPLGADPRRPRVRVLVQDTAQVEMLLDSGAESTHLTQEVAASLALPSGEALARERAAAEELAWAKAFEEMGVKGSATVAPDSGRRIGVHGVSTTRPLAHLPSLAIGTVRHQDLLVTLGDEPILGRDVLGKHAWVLHGPMRELWLLADAP